MLRKEKSVEEEEKTPKDCKRRGKIREEGIGG